MKFIYFSIHINVLFVLVLNFPFSLISAFSYAVDSCA